MVREVIHPMKKQYKFLAIEGGGVKGVAFAGAAVALDELGKWEDIHSFAGSSAGAIFALLAAMDYRPSEMMDLLFQTDFRKFVDKQNYFKSGYSLLSKYGLYSGKNFERWIKAIIKDSLEDDLATFQDLFNKTKKSLHIVGSNLSTKFSEVFSVDTTPYMQLWKAIRISMSIPFFYVPVRYEWDCFDGNQVSSEDCLWCDGGLFLNYPITVFDDARFCNPCENGEYYNSEALGLRVDSQYSIDVLKNHIRPYSNNIKNVIGYTESLVNSLMNGMENYYRSSDDNLRTVYINSLGIKTTEFDLSLKQKKELFDSGYYSVKSFFEQ